MAPWRSGYAEVCKTFYTGSIPVGASTLELIPILQENVVKQVSDIFLTKSRIIPPYKFSSLCSAKICLNNPKRASAGMVDSADLKSVE